MKNRKLVILGMVCALAAMPAAVFGAGSDFIDSGSNSGNTGGQTSQVIEQGKSQTVQNNSQSSQETTTISTGTIAPTTTFGNKNTKL